MNESVYLTHLSERCKNAFEEAAIGENRVLTLRAYKALKNLMDGHVHVHGSLETFNLSVPASVVAHLATQIDDYLADGARDLELHLRLSRGLGRPSAKVTASDRDVNIAVCFQYWYRVRNSYDSASVETCGRFPDLSESRIKNIHSEIFGDTGSLRASMLFQDFNDLQFLKACEALAVEHPMGFPFVENADHIYRYSSL